mgnify:CR=1 FL=1
MAQEALLKSILVDLQQGPSGHGISFPKAYQNPEDEGFVIPWHHRLATINVALTGRCNLRCPCCYKDLDGKEIPLDRMLHTIDRLHEAGWGTTIMLAGGEPMLYKGLYDVIKHARGYGMEVYLGTNGTLLNEKNVAKLAEADVSKVCIGVDPSLVEKPDKDPRAYEKTIRAFGRLRDKGVPNLANLIVTHQNVDIVPEMIEVLLSEGADGINLLRPKPQKVGNWIDDSRLTWQDIKKLQWTFASCRRKQMEVWIDCSLGMLLEGMPRDLIIEEDPTPSCCAGIDYCSIEQDGSIVACPDLKGAQFVAGNILTSNLDEVWKDGRSFRELRAPRDYSGSCGECYLKNQCGGCRAVALAEGDLNQADPDCPKGHESKLGRLWRRTRFLTQLAISNLAKKSPDA